MAPSSSSARGAWRALSQVLDALLALVLAISRPLARLLSSITRKPRRQPESQQRRQDLEHTPSTATPASSTTMNVHLPAKRAAPPANQGKQENAPPDAQLAAEAARMQLDDGDGDGTVARTKQGGDVARPPATPDGAEEDPVKAAERAIHQGFMDQALDMARLALRTNETPVGCVLVHNGRVIAKGMNATNVTRNGTRHAELMALSALLSYTPQADMEQPAAQCREILEESWGDVDPEDGHLFPYGQKLHPAPRVDKTIVKDCILYVTVEPCVMCASMLRQFGIKKVYFGAVNDKFGGTGGVFFIHVNSDSVSAPPSPTLRPAKGRILRPMLHRKPLSCTEALISPENSGNGSGKSIASTTEGNSNTETEDDETNELSEPFRRGDGGNVEAGYEVEGGWGRDEAVTLLRQFYVQENGRAPVPRKKEGRAARLAAMMEKDSNPTEGATNGGLSLAHAPAHEATSETVKDSPNMNGDSLPSASPAVPFMGSKAQST